MSDLPPEGLRFRFVLPSHPASVAVCRAAIRGLTRVVPRAPFDDIEVIVSELVTNSVRHGSRGLNDTVEFEFVATAHSIAGRVRDQGPPFAFVDRAPQVDRVGGFGLHIARSLSSSVSLERVDGGNAVSFVVQVADSPS